MLAEDLASIEGYGCHDEGVGGSPEVSESRCRKLGEIWVQDAGVWHVRIRMPGTAKAVESGKQGPDSHTSAS